jgi:hypothetical protein
MKTIKYISIVLLVVVGLLTGCAPVAKIFGKSSAKESAAKTKIEKVDTLLSGNLKDKMSEIANLNYGVGYALDKETNASKNVNVAKDLNSRSLSVSGVPSLDDMKKMKQMVDDLTSQLQAEKERGQAELESKDKEIGEIQNAARELEEQKDLEIKKYMTLAESTANKADAAQAQLNEMDKWLGLGAIWYGLKHLITRLAWILGIGSILFIILRIASISNPIASGIFGIFDQIGSWGVHVIQVLVPKAVSLAGNVSTAVFNSYKSTLTKIVDAIQMAESNATAAGKTATIQDALNEVTKTMSSSEKDIVDDIKKALNWK